MATKRGVAPAVHVERRSETIGVDDARALFRLEGELHELPSGSDEQLRHALEGLRALVGAQVCMWGSFADLVQTGGAVSHAVHFGWATDRDRETYNEYLREGQVRLPDPTIARVEKVIDEPVSTFVRTQLIEDREWYRTAHVEAYRQTCDIDYFLHSVWIAPEGGHVISLHRPWGQRRFSERERKLVNLFHRESRALKPRAAAPALPAHLERTLRALLRGLREKEVAAELGLSPHTVHEYVGTLYRRFGVGSRAELFAKLAKPR